MARPEYWTEEKKEKAIEIILKKISEEKLSLRKALENRDVKTLPAPVTFIQWLSESDELAKQYAYACEERAEGIFDEMFDIADDSSNDVEVTDNGIVVKHEEIQRSRLRVDIRKWALSKMNPKKFGDQSKLTLEGGINVTNKQDYSEYSTEDLELIANISKKYEKKKD